jgi:hypothetical protein
LAKSYLALRLIVVPAFGAPVGRHQPSGSLRTQWLPLAAIGAVGACLWGPSSRIHPRVRSFGSPFADPPVCPLLLELEEEEEEEEEEELEEL